MKAVDFLDKPNIKFSVIGISESWLKKASPNCQISTFKRLSML